MSTDRDPGGPSVSVTGAAGVQVGSNNVQTDYFFGSVAGVGEADAPAPPSEAAVFPARGHAFISYVREDSGQVDRLQRLLQAAGLPVWRDTASLWPGENWRAKIRHAITRDALVFIACFSSHSAGGEPDASVDPAGRPLWLRL